MGKRFTEASKWRDAWFMNLEAKHKLLWLYLVDNCDAAGVWAINQRLAEFEIGERFDMAEALVAMAGRVVALDGGRKWHLVKFIQFQYPHGLSPTSHPHRAVLRLLANHGLPAPTQVASGSLPGRLPGTLRDPIQRDKGGLGEGGVSLHDPLLDMDKDEEGGVQRGERSVAVSLALAVEAGGKDALGRKPLAAEWHAVFRGLTNEEVEQVFASGGVITLPSEFKPARKAWEDGASARRRLAEQAEAAKRDASQGAQALAEARAILATIDADPSKVSPKVGKSALVALRSGVGAGKVDPMVVRVVRSHMQAAS